MEGVVVFVLPKMDAGMADAPGPLMVFLLGLSPPGSSLPLEAGRWVGGGVDLGIG